MSNDQAEASSLPRGLLGRRGAPAGKATRLPSMRAPRDLTLGGVRKKTFAPNIPVRREKSAEELSFPDDGTKSTHKVKSTSRPNVRGRGRGREVIQSHSIFEQGPSVRTAAQSRRGGGSSGGGGGGGGGGGSGGGGSSLGSGSKSKLKLDDEDSKKVMDELLRDDFVAHGVAVTSSEPWLEPTKLPLNDLKGLADEAKFKVTPKADVKVKQEVKDGDSDVITVPEDSNDAKSESDSAAPLQSAAEFFLRGAQSEEGELLFFQLPDVLPGDPPLRDDEPNAKSPRSKTKQDTKKVTEDKDERNSLADFDEGFIGKLRVHQSGRTTLDLGHVTLDVMLGMPTGFLQELVSLRLDEGGGEAGGGAPKGGDVAVLGRVQHKFVCVPDFESLLKES